MTNRQLSCFFAREFFWLFIENKLDLERRTQVEDHLVQCKQCQVLLERVKASRKILVELSHTVPTPELVAYLKQEHRFWEDFFDKIGVRPSSSIVQWGIQLGVVAFVLILTVHLFPWLNLVRSIKKKVTAPIAITSETTPDKNTDDVNSAGSDDGVSGASIHGNAPAEGQGAPASPTIPNSTVVYGPKLPTPEEIKKYHLKIIPGQTTEAKEAKGPEESKVSGAAASPSATMAKALAQKPESVATESTEMNDEDDDSSPPTSAESATMAGFVWRGALKVSNLTDDVAERVTQLISDLGGKKAGQVELGWHRGDQRYYHFTLPEENYEKFLSGLNNEGFVELKKERHPRVIKAGYMRIILTVQEESE